jgi:hypothetical protein
MVKVDSSSTMVKVDGCSAVFRITEAMAEDFEKKKGTALKKMIRDTPFLSSGGAFD